jgi:hypothetical protein
LKFIEYYKKRIDIFQNEYGEKLQKIEENRRSFYAEEYSSYHMTKENHDEYYVYKELEVPKANKIKWKLVRRLGEPLISSISNALYQDDGVEISVKDDDVVLPASIVRNTLQALLPKVILTRQNCKAIARNAVVDGSCFIAVDWKDQKIKRENEIPKKVYDYLKIIDEVDDTKSSAYRKTYKTKVITRDGKYYNVVEMTDTKPVIDVIRADEVFFDVNNNNFEDLDYFGYRKITSVINAAYILGEKERKIKKLGGDENDTCVITYFYYRKDKKIYKAVIVSKIGEEETVSNENVISNDEYNSPYFGFPIVPVKGFDGEDPILGDGLAEFVKDYQSLQSASINGIVDNITRANFRTTFVKKTALDDNAMKQYMAGYPIVEVNARQGSLRDVIFSPDFAPIPSSTFAIIDKFSEYAKDDAGIGRESEVRSYSSSQNYQAALQIAKVKEEDIVINIEDSLSKLGVILAKYIVNKLSLGDMERISGISVEQEIKKHTNIMANEVQQALQVELDEEMQHDLYAISEQEVIKTLKDFDIEYDITVKINSSSRVSGQINKILAFINTIRSTGENVSREVVQEFGRKVAELMGYKDVSNNIYTSAQPDPITSELKQLEVEEKKAEIYKTTALAKNAEARAALVESKAYKESIPSPKEELEMSIKQAQAENLRADAQKKSAEALNMLGGKDEPQQ